MPGCFLGLCDEGAKQVAAINKKIRCPISVLWFHLDMSELAHKTQKMALETESCAHNNKATKALPPL
jgi:hypothetical protein